MEILNWKLFLEKIVGDKSISNKQSYIDGMNLSLSDKSFFIDLIDFDVIVDFGCADGSFLKHISKIKPNVKLIAYDLDDDMLEKAKAKLGKKALVTSNWEEVVNTVHYYKKPLLNLSSVIHEVYSYSNSMTIKYFWDKQVFNSDFKWVSIRDMIPSVELSKNEINKFKDDVKNVKMKTDKYYLNSFEIKWGSINDNYKTFIHYLLKYRFTDNWEREVLENYLPVSLETLKKKIPNDYKIVFEDDFLLPFLKSQVKKDFNVELIHPTHVKMIIENELHIS